MIGLLGLDPDLRLTQLASVEYDSDLAWKPTERHGGKVTLSVSVDKDDADGESIDRKKAKVDFQKKVDTTWVTVKTVKTNAEGIASATITYGRKVWATLIEQKGPLLRRESGPSRSMNGDQTASSSSWTSSGLRSMSAAFMLSSR